MGENQCKEGYADTRCAACADGYYRLSGACEVCPKCPQCAFLAFIFFAVLVCAIGHWLAQRKVKLNMLSIFIDYFQTDSCTKFPRRNFNDRDCRDQREMFEILLFFSQVWGYSKVSEVEISRLSSTWVKAGKRIRKART